MYALIVDDARILLFDSLRIYGFYPYDEKLLKSSLKVLELKDIITEDLDPDFRIQNLEIFLYDLCKNKLGI